ncbi:MAG: riboflavin synthase [Chloroflexi bacterium]|nr:riboflavin synthase [Chloroflexota bacterium]
MFTGIVEEVGSVKAVEEGRLVIGASEVLGDVKVGDSIAVNGACLTVTTHDESGFSVDVVPETLRRTNLGELTSGSPVNLERSMPAYGRFGGHMVQGHVDGTATIRSVESEGDALMIIFDAPTSVMRYVVEKGFIAVDGASLTIVNCDNFSFSVTIIPHTRENTVFKSKGVGDSVNLEVDIMAKYIERLAMAGRAPVDTADEL